MTSDDRPIGRRHEQTVLGELLDAAEAGNGRLLVLEGVSGVGKTTLIQDVREHAEQRGFAVYGTTGSELETDYPFSALLKSFVPWYAKLTADERSSLSQGRAGAAMSLLDSTPQGTSDDFSIILGLYWLTVRLSEEHPLLLVVDDAQWIDEPSLRFLNYLASSLEDLPILLTVAVRLGDPRAGEPLLTHLAGLPASRILTLAEFSPAEVADLLHRDAPALEAVPDAADRLHAATGGNPFLLRELLTDISERGDTGLHDLGSFAPRSVQRHIAQRITRLGPQTLSLARAFAVLGTSASLDLAAHATEIDMTEAAGLVDRLIAADILQSTTHPAFSHPTVRAAVLADMSPSEISTSHSRIAYRMHQVGEPANDLAHHLVSGIPTSDGWAVDAVRSAAVGAARNGMPSTAVRYLQHAVEVLPVGEGRALLEVDLALAEVACGAIASAIGRLENALPHLRDGEAQARCLHALGQTLVRHARYDEAIPVLERCRELAWVEDRELALEVEGLILTVAYFLDGAAISVDRADPQMMHAITEASSRTPAERGLLPIAALHAVLGRPPARHGARLAAQALADDDGRPSSAIQLDYVAILALIYADEFSQAAETIQVRHDRALRTAAVPAIAEACLLQCTLDLTRGRVSDAEVNAAIAVNAMEQGWSALAPMAQGLMLLCLVQRAELERAQALAETVAADSTSAAGALHVWTLMGRGHLHLARGENAEALSVFLAAGSLLTRHEATSPAILRWRSLAGRAALACGDPVLARDLIESERHLAVEFGLPRIEALALCDRALLDPPGERLGHLQRACDMLEDAGNPVDLAESLCHLGAELRTHHQLPLSREVLRRGLELAHRHGAAAVEARLREELRLSGARMRQASRHGIHALSPTERRIADLAARGLTNSEIGQEVFLARSTVAWYMRKILQKLDLQSRSELEARLVERPDG